MRTHGAPAGGRNRCTSRCALCACTACTWVIATHHTCPVRNLSYIECLRSCMPRGNIEEPQRKKSACARTASPRGNRCTSRRAHARRAWVIATHHTCPVRYLSYIACLRNWREPQRNQSTCARTASPRRTRCTSARTACTSQVYRHAWRAPARCIGTHGVHLV